MARAGPGFRVFRARLSCACGTMVARFRCYFDPRGASFVVWLFFGTPDCNTLFHCRKLCRPLLPPLLLLTPPPAVRNLGSTRCSAVAKMALGTVAQKPVALTAHGERPWSSLSGKIACCTVSGWHFVLVSCRLCPASNERIWGKSTISLAVQSMTSWLVISAAVVITCKWSMRSKPEKIRLLLASVGYKAAAAAAEQL